MIGNGIMMRDLARLANSADAQLPGRGTTDLGVLADFEFLATHGITREQFAESQRIRARQDFEARVVADLDGEPPGSIMSGAVGALSATPQRARLARYIEWRDDEAMKLANLEQRRAELMGLKSKPAETESKIQAAIRRTADYLMGRTDDGGDELDRKGLDERLAIERHRAQAADTVLPELERQIEIATMRVQRLRERESEFVRPAIFEHGNQYGAEYLRCVAALRKAIAPLAGMSAYLGGNDVRFELPGFHVASLSDANLEINCGDAKPWQELSESWGAIPLPKHSWLVD